MEPSMDRRSRSAVGQATITPEIKLGWLIGARAFAPRLRTRSSRREART
jgi:hypothetical protein